MHAKDDKHSHRAWFWLLVAAVLVISLLIGAVATGTLCITSDVRPESRYTDTLPTNQTSDDQDGDGINNQADILEGALAYVSDRRNEHGVPYLIHHASPFQLAYEEDVLKSYGEIVGHYRMG